MKKIYLFILIFLSLNCFSQGFNWENALSVSGNADDIGNVISLDSEGNIYIAGYFYSNSLNVQGYTIINHGLADIFLIKFNSLGEVLWAKNFGGNDYDYNDGLFVDQEDNVYITGYYNSFILEINDTVILNNGEQDIFMAKFNPEGQLFWVKGFGGIGDEIANDINSDIYGNIYFTGYFDSPEVYFDENLLQCPNYLDDVFVVKMMSTGNVLWAKQAEGNDADRGFRITTDLQSNVMVSGGFGSSSLTIGEFTINNYGSWDVFLAKFNSEGDILWLNGAKGQGTDYGYGITTDDSGNIYTTGYYDSPFITFGPYTVYNEGSNDFFVTKYQSDGFVEWVRSYGGYDDDRSYSIVTSDSENVLYTTGYFTDVIILEDQTLQSNGFKDILLIKLDYSGNLLNAENYGGNLDDLGRDIEINPQNELYVHGLFKSDYLTFGDYTLTNLYSGSFDLLMAYEDFTKLPFAQFDYLINDLFVSFINKSFSSETYLWSFGDGNTSEEENPSHSYSEYGEYEVELIAYNEFGSDTLSQTIILCQGLIASFEIQKLTDMSIQTTNYSLYADSYLLELGDGSFSYDPEITYTYSEEGLYQVVLTAYNQCTTDTAVRWINICRYPISGFDWALNDLSVAFINTSTFTDSCLWMFGDGTFSNAWEPFHVYQSYGSWDVTLITWNDCSSDTLVQTIGIWVGLDESGDGGLFSIYPNPSPGALHIVLNESLHPPICIELRSMDGTLVRQKTITQVTSEGQIRFEGFPPGCFLLTLTSTDRVFSRKIIVY